MLIIINILENINHIFHYIKYILGYHCLIVNHNHTLHFSIVNVKLNSKIEAIFLQIKHLIIEIFIEYSIL